MIVVVLLIVFSQSVDGPLDNVTLKDTFKLLFDFQKTYIVFQKENPRQVPGIGDFVVEVLVMLGSALQVDHVKVGRQIIDFFVVSEFVPQNSAVNVLLTPMIEQNQHNRFVLRPCKTQF